jgi:hypothetical protein
MNGIASGSTPPLTDGDRDFIRAVSALELRCQEEIHTYLKFYDD